MSIVKSLTVFLQIALFFYCHNLSGQIMKGIITDSLNDPVFNASIYCQECEIGTVTDDLGRYSIELPSNGDYTFR